MTAYRVVRRRSTAAEFHALEIPDPPRAEVWVHEITAPAVVLGSTQREDAVDLDACRRAGVDVVRRRSGGGAVLLVPDQVVWVDVILPAGSPGWADDVHRPMVWLGERFVEAFSAAGTDGAVVHDGAMVSTGWSRLVCFDGLGPGELTLGGAKLVGISQRRTRAAARLQACWYHEYDSAILPGLLHHDLDVGLLRPPAIVSAAVAHAVPEYLLASLRSVR
ncbi:lipoate--protein ligase family protein [Ilumatobacter sp.]|uniref:lipoate--protein ligase family protein n=1 Tax=Ilumatobacter sp. TaxID=1967498 RepID=UPI003C515510